MKIYQAIAKIMGEVEPISKSRKNEAQGYKFRGIDDTYSALQLILSRNGVFTVPEVIDDRTEDRLTSRGNAIIYRVFRMKYKFFADDGSCVEAVVVGEGMDTGDKASNKAMSVAHKYALLQVFMIPTEEAKDPEMESHELSPKNVTDRVNGKPNPAKVAEAHAKNSSQNLLGPHPDDRVEVLKWAEAEAKKIGVEVTRGALVKVYDVDCKDKSKREAAMILRDYLRDVASLPN